MPKVTITFNLPDEQYDYKLCNNAGKMSSIIYEFTQLVRTKTKYGDGKSITWEDVREAWWNELNDEKFDPYEE